MVHPCALHTLHRTRRARLCERTRHRTRALCLRASNLVPNLLTTRTATTHAPHLERTAPPYQMPSSAPRPTAPRLCARRRAVRSVGMRRGQWGRGELAARCAAPGGGTRVTIHAISADPRHLSRRRAHATAPSARHGGALSASSSSSSHPRPSHRRQLRLGSSACGARGGEVWEGGRVERTRGGRAHAGGREGVGRGRGTG